MTNIKARAEKLAKRILKEHQTRSWRKIVNEDFPGVKPGTLNRFAKELGEYIPTEESILIALGLKKVRKKRRVLPKWFQQSNDALQWFNQKRQTIKKMAKDTTIVFKNWKNNGR